MSQDQNEIESIAELVRDTEQVQEQPVEGGPAQHFMVLNKSSSVHDFDHLLDKPRRTKRDFELKTLDSFIDYVNRYKKEHTSIFAKPLLMDDDSRSGTIATAFIDYHGKDEAGWCEHKLSLGYETSPEWRVWDRKDNVRFNQRAMINFIKDNTANIIEPDVGTLVQEMTRLTVNSSGKLVVTEGHLSAGRQQEREITVNAVLPEVMKLQLTPIVGGQLYVLNCRFNVMPDLDAAEVDFSFTINNRDETVAAIYRDYCLQLGAIENVKLYK